jgi:hypothetical protein
MFWILVDGQNSNSRLSIEIYLACQQNKGFFMEIYFRIKT